MNLFIRINKAGHIEETMQHNGHVFDIQPLGIVQEYIKHKDSRKVYAAFNIEPPELFDHAAEDINIYDLQNAFDHWLLKDQKTPVQRFNLPDKMQRNLSLVYVNDRTRTWIGNMTPMPLIKKEMGKDEVNADFSLTEKGKGKVRESQIRESAYRSMAHYLDMTSSRPFPYMPRRGKKEKGLPYDRHKRNADGEIEYNEDRKGNKIPVKETVQVDNYVVSFARLYSTIPEGGLLALAWGEIAYSLENNAMFRYCRNDDCGRIYQYSKDRRFYCSKKCAANAEANRLR